MIVNFRYTGINLSGWIQEVVMNEKSILCVFYIKSLKYNIKTAHWVVHSQLKSLDTDVFKKMTPVVDDIQAIEKVNTIEQWYLGGK